MNHTKTARRIAVALTVPALLFTAACGSDDGGDDSSKAASGVKVSGKFGAKPKITVPKDAKAPGEAVVKTVSEGDGAKVTKDSFVRLDFAGQTMKDSKDLGSTWAAKPGASPDAARAQAVAQMGKPSQLMPTKVIDSIVGKKSGSRVEIEGTAKALIGAQLNPQSGIKPTDGLVWVVDVVAAEKVDPKAQAKGDQAKPDDGLPEVTAEGEKAAKIKVTKGEKAPKGLEQQVLIKGDGAEVKSGDGLIAQYTGVKWEDGKKFDSSWDHGGATAFQIGTGSVIQGWDKSLVGKHIGDRVELVIPPKQAYGADPKNKLAKNTLVFVVDIVGKV
ncbi:FKBP-type peptidyl-prolyl cis-trans isomerase [Streptomyces sp. H27-D2]|uniref:FKBP-type peptidyl-prolyl cis-trans isomerase n=1 Tax=Streptomyces sp. H27-D2 TaxID=3046304 RepID=UPI002DB58167|nr:FKBP-type peptidyl-prolyl cis-trans isomerase [Streptomyces sp. H27-D2]MEC4016669.1 FKBP-type peptidyl-prolyl cis-trans isomerase [Streptomyces sp. H27-D2]